MALSAEGKPVLRGPQKEVTPRLLAAIRWHRDEIVKRLTPVVKSVVPAVQPLDPCPKCGKATDSKARCWGKKCGWRACKHCGKDTGNPFVAHCWGCQFLLRLTGGWADDE